MKIARQDRGRQGLLQPCERSGPTIGSLPVGTGRGAVLPV
jgi:hypothetical protein